MHLKGIDFGCVMNASGARNFFGQGYPFHIFFRHAGLDYDGSTFVAKTMTLEPRVGNMPINAITLQPTRIFPRCIAFDILYGHVLNAVGLSNTGACDLLQRGEWQERTDPFFISFAAVKPTVFERLDEWRKFADLFAGYYSAFKAPVGLEMNFSCPNTGTTKPLISEIQRAMTIVSCLNIPLVPKINVLVSPATGLEIASHDSCDAVCQSNTIPWGEMSKEINWFHLFQVSESPLKNYGGGGLSGPALFPLVREWVVQARNMGLCKPIIACGGIMSAAAVDMMFCAGASAIQLGSVSMIRPWRVRSMIRCAHSYRTIAPLKIERIM